VGEGSESKCGEQQGTAVPWKEKEERGAREGSNIYVDVTNERTNERTEELDIIAIGVVGDSISGVRGSRTSALSKVLVA